MNVHMKNLEAQLDTWKSKINAFEAVIDGPGEDDCRCHLDNLKAKYTAARERVNELKAAGDENWDLHKADIWIAWNEFETAFQDFQQFVLAKKGKQPMELVKTKENNKAKNGSTDGPLTIEQRTRFCTNEDKHRMKTWISSNSLENVQRESERLSRKDEPKEADGECNSVTNIKKKIDIRNISSVENVSLGTVLRPDFRRHREPRVTNAAFNYEKFVDHIAQLCSWKEHPTGNFGKKKEEKLLKEVSKDRSDLDDE